MTSTIATVLFIVPATSRLSIKDFLLLAQTRPQVC